MKPPHPAPRQWVRDELPRTERLFLWAIRAWSAHHGDLTFAWWSLERAFAREGIGGALAAFHQMMSALFAGWPRWPDIRCPECEHIGVTEESLLLMLAALQSGDDVGVRRELHALVLRPSMREVLLAASECVRTATAAGLQFASLMSPHAQAAHPPHSSFAATQAGGDSCVH